MGQSGRAGTSTHTAPAHTRHIATPAQTHPLFRSRHRPAGAAASGPCTCKRGGGEGRGGNANVAKGRPCCRSAGAHEGCLHSSFACYPGSSGAAIAPLLQGAHQGSLRSSSLLVPTSITQGSTRPGLKPPAAGSGRVAAAHVKVSSAVEGWAARIAPHGSVPGRTSGQQRPARPGNPEAARAPLAVLVCRTTRGGAAPSPAAP